jgi:hypothetical protein
MWHFVDSGAALGAFFEYSHVNNMNLKKNIPNYRLCQRIILQIEIKMRMGLRDYRVLAEVRLFC